MSQPKLKTKRSVRPLTKFERLMNSPRAGLAMVFFSSAVLFFTTLLWAIVGASLQNENADQLVDSYLFESTRTAQGASFPGQHTFLFKWPVFWLQHIFGYSQIGFVALTTLVVLLTVGGLVYLIWRIEKRPFVFGMFCLALASILLLVPPVPYPGALLPVNMAMLTTRNLEYLLYIAGLVLVAGTVRYRSVKFMAAVGCLGLLFASDRLFGSLSLGGALVALAVYTVAQRLELKQLAMRWLVATGASFGLAALLLALLNSSGVVHIVGQSTNTPYGLVPNIHALTLAVTYLLAGIFTNFGANPAYSATTLASSPHVAKVEMLSIGGLAYIVNLFLLCIGIWMCLHLIRGTLQPASANKKKNKPTRLATKLGVMLIYSTAAAAVSYIATNHYYLVDSRYLTIALFAVFVSAAAYSRGRVLQPKLVAMISMLLLLAILSGSYAVLNDNSANKKALAAQRDRTTLIAAALEGHRTEIVVGNYWRVLPLKLASKNQQTVLPMANCTTPRNVLTSDTWQPDLQRHSFAYLLSIDSGDKDFANCSLDKVITAYGKPNTSTLIAGTNENPREVILFYDHGLQPSARSEGQSKLHSASSIRPITPKELTRSCKGQRTILQIVAHEDDDLLFMNPDLQHAIKQGDCVRTVYLTAGDAGAGKFYWLGREQGSEAAYGVLAEKANFWVEQTVKFANHEFATVATPTKNDQLSLIFMHLPDGNMDGQGFAVSEYESLAKLDAQLIPKINTVDKQSYYTRQSLLRALSTLVDVYQPNEVRTQLPYSANTIYTDHSDHTAVGRFATEVFKTYKLSHPAAQIAYYIGYPIHASEPNVSGAELAQKEQAFMTYSNFDGAACNSPEKCARSGVYEAYLTRQYRIDDL